MVRDEPFSDSYTLGITAPTPLLYTGSLTVQFSVISKPSTVSEADALNFVSATPPTISFPAAGAFVTTTINVNVGVGFAGLYKYEIRLSGWPAGVVDNSVSTLEVTVRDPDAGNDITPTVSLVTPTEGATATYFAATNTPATFAIEFSATVAAGGRPIDSLSATFGGAPLVVTATGLGTTSATGTATSPSITTPGTYTVRVGATNLAGTSFDSVDVNVVVEGTPPEPPPFCAEIQWLLPVSRGQTVNGGSIVPIRFILSCPSTGQRYLRDPAVVVAIYEEVGTGVTPAPTLFTHAGAGPASGSYAIIGGHYHLNFPTVAGVHRYRIEVYRPLEGNLVFPISSRELNTK
jgi:hypothetical protein